MSLKRHQPISMSHGARETLRERAEAAARAAHPDAERINVNASAEGGPYVEIKLPGDPLERVHRFTGWEI